MHPPSFTLQQRLAGWPNCRLEVQCCKGVVLYPVRLLAEQHGNRTFENVLRRLRCGGCGGKPAPVYLCVGHHTNSGGAAPDWAIELVRPLRHPVA
jgi:hypothetical protein